MSATATEDFLNTESTDLIFKGPAKETNELTVGVYIPAGKKIAQIIPCDILQE